MLKLDPLPCWQHLTEEQRRVRVAALVEDIELEVANRRKRTGAKPLGVAAVLAQDPLQKPKKTKKSPAPAFHAASKAVRRELWNAYALFVAAYRDAAEKLRAGVRDVKFPPREFPAAVAVRERVGRRETSWADGSLIRRFERGADGGGVSG